MQESTRHSLISAASVAATSTPARISIPTASAAETKIQCVEEDGVIQLVKVRCSCGCEIEIACEYDE